MLTKRSLRLRRVAEKLDWPSNLWMGVSVENAAALQRVDRLRDVPAAVRFLSCEPLLGPLSGLNLDGIHWVIAGGESGPNHRFIDADWVREIRDGCQDAGVAFFFKLLCTTDRCSATVAGCAITEPDTAAVSHLPAMTGA